MPLSAHLYLSFIALMQCLSVMFLLIIFGYLATWNKAVEENAKLILVSRSYTKAQEIIDKYTKEKPNEDTSV